MEKGKFEGSMSDAFENAEVSPSENSWNNIALELEKANGQRMKKRLLFYQMLAAASVVFAMGISFGMYVLNEKNVNLAKQLSTVQQNVNSSTPISENQSDSRVLESENTQRSTVEKDAAEDNVESEKLLANRLPDHTENSTATKDIANENASLKVAD